jgi:hypothetical protein
MSKICKLRRRYYVKEKKKFLVELKYSGYRMSTYAQMKNIPLRTLKRWKMNTAKIFSTEKKYLNNKKIGSGRKPVLNRDMEIKLLDWFLSVRSEGIPITNDLIICRAKFLREEMNPSIKCEFSKGWVEKFKNRYNIIRRKGGSKIVRKSDCEITKIIDFVELVNKEIDSGQYSSIINIDETGLYYEPMINFTLDTKGTKRVEIKTTGREKQRVTIVLGVYLLNQVKIKPVIIFKGETIKCLENRPTNDSYDLSFQENSWYSDDQFIKFLSHLPKNKNILLLYDNFRGHKTEKVTKFIKDELPLAKKLLLPLIQRQSYNLEMWK